MFQGIVECVNQPRYWGLRHQGPRGCGENVGHWKLILSLMKIKNVKLYCCQNKC